MEMHGSVTFLLERFSSRYGLHPETDPKPLMVYFWRVQWDSEGLPPPESLPGDEWDARLTAFLEERTWSAWPSSAWCIVLRVPDPSEPRWETLPESFEIGPLVEPHNGGFFLRAKFSFPIFVLPTLP